MTEQQKIERLEDRLEREVQRSEKLQRDVDRLQDAITHTVNRLLRQTILMKSHAERNKMNRIWCQELIQIQNIVDDGINGDIDDIPF